MPDTLGSVSWKSRGVPMYGISLATDQNLAYHSKLHEVWEHRCIDGRGNRVLDGRALVDLLGCPFCGDYPTDELRDIALASELVDGTHEPLTAYRRSDATHCKHGHVWAGNEYWRSDGTRTCKLCTKARRERRRNAGVSFTMLNYSNEPNHQAPSKDSISAV